MPIVHHLSSHPSVIIKEKKTRQGPSLSEGVVAPMLHLFLYLVHDAKSRTGFTSIGLMIRQSRVSQYWLKLSGK